jgi:hypothetical protein
MPSADSATVRAVAVKAAMLAEQTRRIGAALGKGIDGWSGLAEFAFCDAVGAQSKQLEVVASRYDGYARTLSAYANHLAALEPRLLRARIRAQSPPTPGVDGAASDEEFDRLWQEWDSARRRCMRGLDVAGRVGADRHGAAALWHDVTHAVEHVDLHEISKALSKLSDALVVAALVFTPIPGVGEVLWAAVAVVAVLQLAVDATRYAEGDKSVSPGDLAWDAVGAVGVGKATKALASGEKEAVEVTKVIKGLEPHASEVNLVPGGGLMAHEAPNTADGHTLSRHVGKSYDYLRSRFGASAFVSRSSTFFDRGNAEHAVAGLIEAAAPRVNKWLSGQASVLVLNGKCDRMIGLSMSRREMNVKPVCSLRVILKLDSSQALGYRILSAFPQP